VGSCCSSARAITVEVEAFAAAFDHVGVIGD
jgi:hypothetical protein